MLHILDTTYEEIVNRTPGIRRALKALGRAKRRNLRRVAKGQKPVVKGKRVSARSIGLSKRTAQQRLRRRRRRR